jgi:hypothetical protein
MSRLGQLFPEVVKRELKRVLPYYRRCYCPVCDHWDHAFQTFGLMPRVPREDFPTLPESPTRVVRRAVPWSAIG